MSLIPRASSPIPRSIMYSRGSVPRLHRAPHRALWLGKSLSLRQLHHNRLLFVDCIVMVSCQTVTKTLAVYLIQFKLSESLVQIYVIKFLEPPFTCRRLLSEKKYMYIYQSH